MRRFPRYCLLCTAALATIVLAVSIVQRLGKRAAALPSLDDSDIPTLVEQLKRAGLEMHCQSSRKDGQFVRNAYLTTTHKDWEELNHLIKDPSRLPAWRGIVYCERVGSNCEPVIHSWDKPCLVAGPFAFFGDAELLKHIDTTLAPFAPPATP